MASRRVARTVLSKKPEEPEFIVKTLKVMSALAAAFSLPVLVGAVEVKTYPDEQRFAMGQQGEIKSLKPHRCVWAGSGGTALGCPRRLPVGHAGPSARSVRGPVQSFWCFAHDHGAGAHG